jgi:cyclopropane fatty-acyl-phospholipid synthase-like methyltransferase
MTPSITMHMARSAMNQDPKVREWAEQFLKNKERAGRETLSDEEFDKHWRYVRPERMHEGAIEAVSAYMQAQQTNQ